MTGATDTRDEAQAAAAYDHREVEARIARSWREADLYRYDPDSNGPVFSVDTPPPYVSAAHLHVGHAMSYAQAEFVVRFRRMRGYSVFYPMGFDDNGLPTERFVEKTHGVNRKNVTRRRFRELCIAETRRGAQVYEAMWSALGLSVDWRLRYSTIDEHCRRTAQLSFLDLHRKGLVYRADEPVLWDTLDATSLAQADLETVERSGKLYDIAFEGLDGARLVIATTRPELIPACVGLFHAPDDPRFASCAGSRARVPLTGHDVPVLSSAAVDPAFGTGLMMVCTFGDAEDVEKWRDHGLDTRIAITETGRMTALCGPYADMTVQQARAAVVADLRAAGLIVGERTVKQAVSVGERSGQPVEFRMACQWFVKLLGLKREMLARSDEIKWHPSFMKVRLDQWIHGLKYDWNISRQRFYGVPFPVWYVVETGDVILAEPADLPVDPLEDPPPAWARERYAGLTIAGEPDVMDTWMTSSTSPLINANWAGTPGRSGPQPPMSVRVQAFEIIRTWLFYTLAKTEMHLGRLPWAEVMISGWGLNEQGRKISKRDLETYVDASGFNRYDPMAVMERYGADALRYWAAGARLGRDLRFSEKDVRAGRKIVIKLWNLSRLCTLYLDGEPGDAVPVPLPARPLEDRALLSRLQEVVVQMTDAFESYDYAVGREVLEDFFWKTYCNNYIEIIKDRIWRPADYGATSRRAAQDTLRDSLRTVVGLFAPYIPFIAEEVYRTHFAAREEQASIHTTAWPAQDPTCRDPVAEADMDVVADLLDAWRSVRSRLKIVSDKHVTRIGLDLPGDLGRRLATYPETLRAALRCDDILFEAGGFDTNRDGWRIGVSLSPAAAEA